MKKLLLFIIAGMTLITLGGCMSQKIPSKAAQIEFLKKNEALITQYVKSISDDSENKITSVEFDWNAQIQNSKSDASNPTAKYDSFIFSGIYVNNDTEQGIDLWVTPHDFTKLDSIQAMGVGATSNKFGLTYFVLGEAWKEYHNGE